MNLSSAIRTAKSVITANSPVLLVGTAITGVIATGVLAAKGGYKARGIIDEAEEERGEELSTQEKLQLTWLCYAIPAVTGASTVASVIGVHSIHTKRHAAMAGLYAITSGKLDDYREKAEEMLGAKKSQLLTNEIAQKAVDENPVIDHEVMILDQGTELCYDDWSGRWFMGSMPIVERAINSINRQLLDDGDASLNDFYDHVGLSPVQSGSKFGWSGPANVSARFGAVNTSDGRPAISVSFHTEPKFNLGSSR